MSRQMNYKRFYILLGKIHERSRATIVNEMYEVTQRAKAQTEKFSSRYLKPQSCHTGNTKKVANGKHDSLNLVFPVGNSTRSTD